MSKWKLVSIIVGSVVLVAAALGVYAIATGDPRPLALFMLLPIISVPGV